MLRTDAPPTGFSSSRPSAERAVSFGRKTGWLAIRHDEPVAILRAIGAGEVRRAPWARGVFAAYRADLPRDNAFVTPSLDGWVLVATSLLPEPGRDGAPLADLLERLSSELDTTVQCFANHSGFEQYLWASAERGVLRRCFAQSAFAVQDEEKDDPTTCDLGPPTEAERDLGFFDPDWKAGASDVIHLAGAWSLDPTRIEQRFVEVAPLWVCTLASTGLR